MPEWKYDASTARYRNADTGRYLSNAQLTGIRDKFSELVRTDMQRVTGSYLGGRISADEWQTQMRQTIKDGHLASYALGRGGRGQMTQRDFGRVGQALRQEYKALGTFKAQLPDMTPEGIANRANLYSETIVGGYERGRVEAFKVADVERLTFRTEEDERVCEECAPLDGQSYDVGDAPLPPIHPRCRCWMEPA